MQGSADRVAHAPACFAEALRRQARWGGDGSQRWHHKSRICAMQTDPLTYGGGGKSVGGNRISWVPQPQPQPHKPTHSTLQEPGVHPLS